MAVAAGEVPRVRRADFTDVPADRAGERIVVCSRVPGVRHLAGSGEMAVFHVPDSDSDGNRFARAAVAGRGQLAGVCGGTDVFGVCAAGPRNRGDSRRKIPASTLAGTGGGNSGRNSWRGFRKLFAVGPGGGIQGSARPRGDGHGRRENDRHDRGVSRLTRDVSDASGGEPAGKRDWQWPYRGFVPRGVEGWSSETREP